MAENPDTAQIVAGYANNVIQQFNQDFAQKYNIPQQRMF